MAERWSVILAHGQLKIRPMYRVLLQGVKNMPDFSFAILQQLDFFLVTAISFIFAAIFFVSSTQKLTIKHIKQSNHKVWIFLALLITSKVKYALFLSYFCLVGKVWSGRISKFCHADTNIRHVQTCQKSQKLLNFRAKKDTSKHFFLFCAMDSSHYKEFKNAIENEKCHISLGHHLVWITFKESQN